MTQQGFGQFGGGGGGSSGSVDPGDIMSGNYQSAFNNYTTNSGFGDDELLDGLSPDGLPHGQDFNNMGEGGTGTSFNHGIYSPHQGNAMPMGQHNDLYSNTPDGDPIQSPYLQGGHSYNGNPLRQMHHPIHSPISGFSGSPLAASELNEARMHMSQSMQRKPSNTRSPMVQKTNAIHPSFGPQPIQTTGLNKSPNPQWMPTPGGSIASYTSGFSSPMQPNLMQLSEVLKGGTSMPAKLGVTPNTVSTQEMKRKRRRESHNLVERRRRDNINERIQDLSKLVPGHRLEDEKVRKMIQNGTPLSPTLAGASTPNQATSGLAGPGARRAAGAGSITTGLPIEEKDKGPNKGDILNGAVSWTRDLMWMLHLKIQQQEVLFQTISDLGGQFPFELADDEKRMQTELMDAMARCEAGQGLTYSRTAGSGLRVPRHTDYKGTPLNGSGSGNDASTSPEDGNAMADVGDSNQFWVDPDDDDSARNSMNFKEEDEYDMDLTQ
jgi:hypothetical protein